MYVIISKSLGIMFAGRMNQRHVYIPLDLVIDPKNAPSIKETSRMCAAPLMEP